MQVVCSGGEPGKGMQVLGPGTREGSRHSCAKKEVTTVLNGAPPRGDFWGPHGTHPGVASKLHLPTTCSLSFAGAASRGPSIRLAAAAFAEPGRLPGRSGFCEVEGLVGTPVLALQPASPLPTNRAVTGSCVLL